MSGHPVNIGGFEIPSDSPLFLSIIAIHVSAGLLCVISGLVAMFAKKQPGRHPKAGKTYYWGMLVVFLTATIVAILRWKEDYYLFLLGLLAYSSAFLGRRAIKLRRHRWATYHVIGMGSSYIILLTAFYVDNGKFLPIWKELPVIVYWTLPTFVGLPIIIFTLLKHPLVKRQG